ncbi:uncharacterized protein LOC130990624 [Salvia miltiorrhiza]|uniref:uncharacterized protein LOC130990624 n=1 Tax=Salvia miltiorrhiza TaxID=226208 RepID=UPI0025ACC090|nr:uncharacterized protein LOC130990624 [Salvia miltiorrhiza]
MDLLTHIIDNTFFIGDFNAVKGAHERKSNRIPCASSCRDFCDFIAASIFIESEVTGLFFTWCGRRLLPSHVESVLDRCLFSKGFSSLWDSLNTHVLPRISSDHSPIVLQCHESRGPRRSSFKFFDMWLLHPEFKQVVQDSWNAPTDTSCPLYTVMMKLKRLKLTLKGWNKQVFGNVDEGIRSLQSSLEEIQLEIAQDGYTDSLFDAEVAVQARLRSILNQKNSLMQQKSRLKIDGVDVFDQDAIAAHIVRYFSSLFSETVAPNVTVQDILPILNKKILQHQNDLLTSIPTEEEIKAVVFDLAGDSAAGPDGFSGSFFQHCWTTIQKDVLKAVRTFFIKNYLPARLNSNTLILIPKKEVVDSVTDLRPIILSNFFFKILSKILASRLSSVATDFVTPNQFGFISGRLIHDCILLGSEGVNCMKRSCQGNNMACKVDIKKAFDTISWKFIWCAMNAMGFDPIFLNWLSTIFSSARLSILYNGQLCGYFPCSRGVRQGDPLSPIIFGIAEDVLSLLILKAVEAGKIDSMRMNRRHLFPTHLLYADDILIFCKASMKNARAIRDIFQFYGSLSGQICSREKSQLYFGMGVSLSYQRQISRALGFSTGAMPMVYLGVPLFIGKPRRVHLAAIKDRIINKFSRWNGLHLSMAGRICLVKSVIQSSLVHTMMIYIWPKSLIKELDSACRNFIWSGDIRKRPPHAVSWEKVCALKEEGGLGIRSFAMMNEAFLMKLAWKIIKGKGFGFDLMKNRYLDTFGRPRASALASSIWGGVKSLVPDLIDESYCLLGAGDSVYFWNDDWMGYKIADKLNIPSFIKSRLSQTVADYFYDGMWHFASEFVEEFPGIVCDILLLPVGNEEDTIEVMEAFGSW